MGFSDELYHYGVLGMKWGVRRTPEQLGHKLKYTSPVIENAKAMAKVTAVSIGSAFIPFLGMAWNANVYKNTFSSIKNNLDGKDYLKTEGEPEKLAKLKKKTVKMDSVEDMKYVNPRIGNQKGAVNNCGYCSVAMEMRSRGYDVRARKKAKGIYVGEYENWFKNVDIKRPVFSKEKGETRKKFVLRSYDKLCTEIEKFGDGSRGYVGVQYEKGGGGHAMFWKVQNGRVTFYDGQNNTTNNDRIFALSDPTKYSYARLDNLGLKEQVTEAVISINEKDR